MTLKQNMWNVYLNIFILIGFINCFSIQMENKIKRSVAIFSNVDNCTTPKCNDTINKQDINDSNLTGKKNCQDTCNIVNLTNQNLLRDVQENNNCFCDDFCYYYGDCCEDIVIQKWLPSNEKLYNQGYLTMMNVTHYTCKEFSKFGVYLVDSCATDWGSDDISSQCKTNITEKENVFLHIPVTNTYINITYKNIYCAVCNNENEEQIKAWTLLMNCYNGDFNLTNKILHDLRYSPDNGLWQCEVPDNVGTGRKNITCTHTIKPGNILINNVRRCKAHIATCLNNWQDLEISNLCQNFTAYRYDLRNVRYKNKYCAVCNGINVNDLHCKISFPHLRNNFNTLSLSLLMDVNWGIGGQKVGKEDTCEKGHIFDSATGVCKQVSCGRYARMIDGICKQLT